MKFTQISMWVLTLFTFSIMCGSLYIIFDNPQMNFVDVLIFGTAAIISLCTTLLFGNTAIHLTLKRNS
jgi:hypothetical protein